MAIDKKCPEVKLMKNDYDGRTKPLVFFDKMVDVHLPKKTVYE